MKIKEILANRNNPKLNPSKADIRKFNIYILKEDLKRCPHCTVILKSGINKCKCGEKIKWINIPNIAISAESGYDYHGQMLADEGLR